MSSLSDIEKRYLKSILEMSGGYVLDYSDANFGEFFRGHRVDIHGTKYLHFGTSKAKKMRAFWMRESDALVGRILAEMLDSYEAKCILSGQEIDLQILEKARTIVGRLLGKPKKVEPVNTVEGFLNEKFMLPNMRKLPVKPSVVPAIKHCRGTSQKTICPPQRPLKHAANVPLLSLRTNARTSKQDAQNVIRSLTEPLRPLPQVPANHDPATASKIDTSYLLSARAWTVPTHTPNPPLLYLSAPTRARYPPPPE